MKLRADLLFKGWEEGQTAQRFPQIFSEKRKRSLRKKIF